MTEAFVPDAARVVYYTSAYVFGERFVVGGLSIDPGRGNAVIHVYCTAPSSPAAGAVLAEMCETLDLQFCSYIYLPAIENRNNLFAPPEHQEAFRVALEKGVGCIVSVLMDDNGNIIEFNAA